VDADETAAGASQYTDADVILPSADPEVGPKPEAPAETEPGSLNKILFPELAKPDSS
jgi:hypothetical protein